jgi:hypothetical protein
VAEVNAGLQQFFHRNGYQTTFSLLIGLCTRRDRVPTFETTNPNRDTGLKAFLVFDCRFEKPPASA